MADHEMQQSFIFFWRIQDWGWMTQVPKKQILRAVAAALRRLPFPQAWQRFCITRIPAQSRLQVPILQECESAPGRHLREIHPFGAPRVQGCSLENEDRGGLAEIVETVPIWLAIFFETRVRERKNHTGAFQPMPGSNPSGPPASAS